MTYRELAKELGIGSSKLDRLAEENVINFRGATLLCDFDEKTVKIIRQCCLFSMLGMDDPDTAAMVKGEAGLRETLKKQLDKILSDETNYTQAAIVIQNIRRECETTDELDPVPYLEHIKELKHSGGLFYDVNTGRLQEKSEPAKEAPAKPKGFASFLGGLMKGDESFYKGNSKEENRGGNPERETDSDYRSDTDNHTEPGNRQSTAENPERNTDLDRKQGIDRNSGLNDESAYRRNNEKYSDSDRSRNTEKISEHYTDSDKRRSTECGSDQDQEPTYRQNTDRNTEQNTDADPNQGNTQGYDEKWSPYTDRGFGASNMGAGNWQGWTAGYGTYTKPIGARERINNGEKTCPHPFRRFAARTLDTTLITLIGGAVLRLGFRVNVGISLKMVAYCEIIFWLFEMMIEPLLISTLGTTPGKWIMGIRVRDMKTGEKLDIKRAYIRALKLAWHGFGFMIPIFTVFKRAMSFMRCRMNDTMPWDEGINVELIDESPMRIVLVVLTVILLNVGDEVVSKQALIPENRGELTQEQFNQNVVELMKYTGYVGDIPDFELDIRNGYVKSVTLKYTDEQTEEDRYDEMYLGFMAFAGASEDSNGIKLLLTSVLGQLKSYYAGFEGSYCGVNVVNTSDSGIRDEGSYNLLFSMLYGAEVSVPAFNQTFTMTK